MTGGARLEFGYHPPSGDRNLEVINPGEYQSDLYRVLDIATQGFGSLWVSDHFAHAGEYRIECWTLLSWLAARYPGVKLGTMVMANSFRSPSLMAKMAASLQELSSGRLILGYGAGWTEEEYRAYGFDFPRLRIRVEMLEAAVQIMKALWAGGPATFSGKHYSVENAYCEPRPEPPPTLLLGGAGEKYTLPLVARHADWWNDLSRPVDELAHKLDVLRESCEAQGRDFSAIRKTLTLRLFIDRSHSKAIETASHWRGADWTAIQSPIVGDPSAMRERFAEFAEMGFDMCICCFPGFHEPGDVRLFMDEVIPAFS